MVHSRRAGDPPTYLPTPAQSAASRRLRLSPTAFFLCFADLGRPLRIVTDAPTFMRGMGLSHQ